MTESNAGATRQSAASPNLELRLTRVFDAPRALVYKVWTDPKHVAQWWGPRDFVTTIREMEVKPGGAWRYSMRGPDGNDYPFDGVFLEVEEPERLVSEGSIHGDPEQKVWTEVKFSEQDGKTTLSVLQRFEFESYATRGAPIGWNQMLDRLTEYLAKA
jgi:uncharacterized protein YndB with AHSA1/START domain